MIENLCGVTCEDSSFLRMTNGSLKSELSKKTASFINYKLCELCGKKMEFGI
ncbi:hypothetical protein [Flavobacterium sp.]|uniref:hypothetical protein n=1 Tax=Flavobacterium sp. TaxID=239 RepID=UPI0031E08D16